MKRVILDIAFFNAYLNVNELVEAFANPKTSSSNGVCLTEVFADNAESGSVEYFKVAIDYTNSFEFAKKVFDISSVLNIAHQFSSYDTGGEFEVTAMVPDVFPDLLLQDIEPKIVYADAK